MFRHSHRRATYASTSNDRNSGAGCAGGGFYPHVFQVRRMVSQGWRPAVVGTGGIQEDRVPGASDRNTDEIVSSRGSPDRSAVLFAEWQLSRNSDWQTVTKFANSCRLLRLRGTSGQIPTCSVSVDSIMRRQLLFLQRAGAQIRGLQRLARRLLSLIIENPRSKSP